jgi:hemerythrin-like domain-containing protein
MPALGALGAEHDRILDLAGRVQRAIARGDASSAHADFTALVADLRVHTAVEEAGLFTELRAVGEFDGHVAGLSREHDATWETIDRLAAMGATGGEWEAAVVSFLDELQDHIGREEYDLYPASIPALASEGWERAADARHLVTAENRAPVGEDACTVVQDVLLTDQRAA